MSRPHTTRNVELDTFPPNAQTETKEAWFFVEGCTGIDKRKPEFRVPKTSAIDIVNLQITSHGALESFGAFGITSNVSNPIALFVHKYNNIGWTVVVTTTGIYLAPMGFTSISSFIPVTGITLTASLNDRFSFISWNATTILVSGQSTQGIIAIDVISKTGTVIVNSPVAAGHISLLNGSVIASHFEAYPTRVIWSAKFDYNDWSGLGSGFEDLQTTSGGENTVYGIYPFSDTVALIPRANSIDYVSATDNFDTPFRFVQRYPDVQITHPRAIVKTPNTLIIPTLHDFLEVGLDQIQSIGKQLNLSTFLVDQSTPSATYWPLRNAYVITGFTAPGFTTPLLHVYKRDRQAWHAVATPQTFRALAANSGFGSTSYDSLNGTYDAQTGTLDTLGISDFALGALIGAGANNLYTSIIGGCAGFYIRTPALEPTRPSQQVVVTEVCVSLDFNFTNEVIRILYTLDGVTWSTYGEFTTSNAIKLYPAKYTVQKTISGRSIGFAVQDTNTLGATATNVSLRALNYIYVRYTESYEEFSG